VAKFSKYGWINRNDPQAAGRCDRGGEIRKRSELHPEMIWAGNRLQHNGFWVCEKHMDPPHPQDKTIILKPDPIPVRDPRPDIDVMAARGDAPLQPSTPVGGDTNPVTWIEE
jgi:hypothetical protein